ncbi:MAG: plasmid partitioning protein [Bacteroidetes bacterium]|jgi:ParB/RepB/Spo0J family partition protein|nr:plasmid partitioning protein [Bacteroidota bacterium]
MKKQAAAKGKTQTKKSTSKNNKQMATKTESKKATVKNSDLVKAAETTVKGIHSGKKGTPMEMPGTDKLVLLSPALLVPNPKNPRIKYEEIEELMESILENGLLEPLTGYYKDDKVILKNGHRRKRAIDLALSKGHEIERVPVKIVPAPTQEQETLDYIIHNDGKPLSMLEQSEVIKRLLNFGWKPADIARKTGKAPGYIANLIILTKLPMKVYNDIVEDRISAHAVIQIEAAVENEEDLLVAVEEAIKTAHASGKSKATPKHVENKQVKGQSFGKFYKWLEEIVDTISGRKDVKKDKEKVASDMLVFFENGQRPKDVAESYFVDKELKAAIKQEAQKEDPKASVKTDMSKNAGKTAQNKKTGKK